MAKNTRIKLLASALELFSQQWYETASVADICRHAGLSNGVFYRYFKNKQAIFFELLNTFLESFSKDLESIEGSDIPARMESLVKIIFSLGVKYRKQVTVFREGQYRYPEYESKLRELYLRSLERVYERKVEKSEYLFIFSGLRFISTRSLYDNIEYSPEIVKQIILEGLFKGSVRKDLFPEIKEIPYIYSDSPESRRNLLETGIALFGKKGYHPVSIFEIVHTAGYAVGTFYTHFPSKQAFLEEIVALIGHTARQFITEHISPGLNRLEQEIQGYWLFLQLFSRHPEFYEIVREAEYVVKEAVTAYYAMFLTGYMKNLEGTCIHLSSEKECQTAISFLMGIAHYLGIEVIFSHKIIHAKTRLTEIANYLASGISQ